MGNRMSGRAAIVAATAVAILATSGCGNATAHDDPLEVRLAGVRDVGATVRLADLTDFAWDEVYLFNEYTCKEAIEKIVGAPAIGSNYHRAGSLLVFENADAVVRTVAVSGDYLRADVHSFPENVLVTPLGANGLRLVRVGDVDDATLADAGGSAS